MKARYIVLLGSAWVVAAGLGWGQTVSEQAAGETAPATPGVEVQARGPVHEAFATPVTEPEPTALVPKAPPQPIRELPPEQKPEGNVVWIPGYWAWDAERSSFWWVSGTWRVPPPGKRWVGGYWRPVGEQWQWVPGFWTEPVASTEASQEVTYLPTPPAAPQVAPPGDAPAADTFYVPGYWVYQGGGTYVWRAGYWAHVQPGYVWVPAHYCWTAGGCVFVPGYWDWTVPRRGVLYAPVVIDPVVVGPTFVYTPCYAVCDAVLLDAFFVGPCCHYYFGDYYGPACFRLGFRDCYAYDRWHYDPIVSYAHWEHGYHSGWLADRRRLYERRAAGVAARPPRTLFEQNRIVNANGPGFAHGNGSRYASRVLVPARELKTATTLASEGRALAMRQAQAAGQVRAQRQQIEATAAAPGAARVARLNVPAMPGASAVSPPTRRAVPVSTRPAGASWSAPTPTARASITSFAGPAQSYRAPTYSTYRAPSEPYRAPVYSSYRAPATFHALSSASMRPSAFTSSGMYRAEGQRAFAAPAWHSSGGGFGGGFHGFSGHGSSGHH
jgi:hypothetical protein